MSKSKKNPITKDDAERIRVTQEKKPASSRDTGFVERTTNSVKTGNKDSEN